MMSKLQRSFKTTFGRLDDNEFILHGYDAEMTPKQITFKHPNCKFQACTLNITKGPAVHPVWHWDGNEESPTLTPSIGCDHRCGLHFSIIDGVMTP